MKRVSVADLEEALRGWESRAHRDGSGPERIQAAVCLPLRDTDDGVAGWCIRRPDRMRHHSREMAFPGGKREAGDVDLDATALRETEEELGIPRARLRIVGRLAAVPTATSLFTLNPVVAEVLPGPPPAPAAGEVDELVSFLLADLFEGRLRYQAVDLGRYLSPIFHFEAGAMYGATAHVLLELYTLYARVSGLELPTPERTNRVPWQ
ncbi:MAG TPA: CoA pyrophosphatase [Candidatus Dormibacteraeota bacterium]|nr:CoA pyrophosphatase [Candidatus Dormibacteraeota bacterium]